MMKKDFKIRITHNCLFGKGLYWSHNRSKRPEAQGLHGSIAKCAVFRANSANRNAINSCGDPQIWLAPTWSFRRWAIALQLSLSALQTFQALHISYVIYTSIISIIHIIRILYISTAIMAVVYLAEFLKTCLKTGQNFRTGSWSTRVGAICI